MADSPFDVATEIAQAVAATTKALATATREALRDAGLTARTEIEKNATEVPGADRKFSKSAKGTNRVRVRVDRDGFVRVAPVGAWGLAEEGAPPHPQPRGRGQHPGTRRTQGKRSWSRGRDAAFTQIAKDVPAKVGDQVEEAFTHGR